MAQDKLNEIMIDVSVRAGDTISSASTDGLLFSSQDRLDAVNGARKILYKELLGSLGPDELLKQYPEFTKVSGNIAKVQVQNVGCHIPGHANNSYTNSTRIITVTPANVNWTDGVTNFTTNSLGADFKNALVILTDDFIGLYPVFITIVEEVVASGQIKLRDAYGDDIAGGNLTAMVSVASSGYYPKPSGTRKIMEVITGGGVYAKEILSRMRFDSKNNSYSKFKGSASFPHYFEDHLGIDVSPDSYNTIQANLLIEPVDAQLGSAYPDIIEPDIWLEDIKDIAVVILLSEQQI